LRRRIKQREAREEGYLRELLHEAITGGKKASKPGNPSEKLDAATEAKIAAQAKAMAAAEASAASASGAGGSANAGGPAGGASGGGGADGAAGAELSEGGASGGIDVIG
jgi:hypothetical protein